MRVRGIDINGDWNYGRSLSNYKVDQRAIEQNIKTRIQSFLGDCFFATNDGIDWWNLLGSKNQVALNLTISSTILKTQGVTGIVKLSTSLDASRKLTLSYEVKTIFSDGGGLENITSTNKFLLDENGNILITEDGQPIISA